MHVTHLAGLPRTIVLGGHKASGLCYASQLAAIARRVKLCRCSLGAEASRIGPKRRDHHSPYFRLISFNLLEHPGHLL